MTDMKRLRTCLCFVVLAVAATGYELHYDANGQALNDVCGLTAQPLTVSTEARTATAEIPLALVGCGQ